MRRLLLTTGFLASVLAVGSAEAQRTVDRLGYSTAPRVRVWFTNGGQAYYGYGMQVEFRTDDDAYVVVGRVDSDGRLTILYPYNRSQRAFVRGNMTTTVRNPRYRSDVSFYASDALRGYVFAIASYTPVDLSVFQSRDFERMGGWSEFTRVNRSVAREPDEYVARLAAELFWGTQTEYDYDVAYYAPPLGTGWRYASAFSYCNSFMADRISLRYPWYTDYDYAMSPYRQLCRDYYLGFQCYSAFAFFVPGACRYYYNRETVIAGLPTQPSPGDSTRVNEGIIRGGLWRPDTVSAAPEDRRGKDPDRAQRIAADVDRRDPKAGPPSEFEGIYSIPARAKQKLARPDDGVIEITRGGRRAVDAGGRDLRDVRRTDGSPSTLGKSPKDTRVAAEVPARVAPPSRPSPTSYEPIGAAKTPKRSSGTYAGNSGSRAEPRYTPRQTGNAAEGGLNTARPSSGGGGGGGNIGQAANTGDKSKDKPPR